MKWLQSIIAICTLLAFSFSAYFYVDNTYAKGKDLALIENRLDFKIQRDVSRDLRNDIWAIKDRYKNINMPVDVQNRLRKLEDDKIYIDKELDILMEQLKKK